MESRRTQFDTKTLPLATPPCSQPRLLLSSQPRLSLPLPTLPCSQPLPSSQPSSSSLLTTPPPCSQKTSVCNQPMKSTLEMASSSSSVCSNSVPMIHNDDKLNRILTTVKEVVHQCRICWVSKEVSRSHTTFRCPTKICSGGGWKTFKLDLQFPRGTVCYFCFATFGPPFNHARAQHGARQLDLCEFPDVLKELVYILFHDQSLREKIFSQLGLSPPDTLSQYKRYITKANDGELIGAYKIVDAYLDVRGGED